MDHLCYFCLVFLCFHARLFIDALWSPAAVFCRGRDPARIWRKFQQSHSGNTLVANLVPAEFLEIINFFTVYGFYWPSSIKKRDKIWIDFIICAKMKALGKRKVKLFTIPRSFNFYTHSSSHLIYQKGFPR